MTRKKIPLSLRISDEDAAFLADYKPEGAVTPSEKVRYLLTDARERLASKDPDEARTNAAQFLGPGKKKWRFLEKGSGNHSDLILKLYDRSPDLFGLLMTGPKDKESLRDFEAELSVEVARIMEEVLLLYLSDNYRAYEKSSLGKELIPALTLLNKIHLSKQIGERDA